MANNDNEPQAHQGLDFREAPETMWDKMQQRQERDDWPIFQCSDGIQMVSL